MLSTEQYIAGEIVNAYRDQGDDDPIFDSDRIYLYALGKLGKDYYGCVQPREFFDEVIIEYCDDVREELGHRRICPKPE